MSALVAHLITVSDGFKDAARRIRRRDLSNYDPTPTAWDFAFRGMGYAFVRALTTDGRWIGGYFGTESYASSFPQPREIFLEQAFQMEISGRGNGSSKR